jgi:hypothetical protein
LRDLESQDLIKLKVKFKRKKENGQASGLIKLTNDKVGAVAILC